MKSRWYLALEMLVARGRTTLGNARLQSTVVLGPRIGAVLIDREGLVFDARFMPASAHPPRPHAFVYVLLDGRFSVSGGPDIVAPAAFVLAEEQFEGANGSRSFLFRTSGRPFRAIEIHLEQSDLRRALPAASPPMISLGEAAWRTCADLFDAASDDDLVAKTAALVRRLVESGLVAESAVPDGGSTPATASRLWRSVRPVVERHAPLATLKELGGELSLRQLARDVDAFTSAYKLFVRGGWRETMSLFRLKLGVLFCSAEDMPVSEVARAVGYGSAEAMSRAFRDAGLVPPRELQQQLRATREHR